LAEEPQIHAPFSTWETVIDVRGWSDFALSANRGERVSDALGTEERMLLTGKFGNLRKTSPSIAIVGATYPNEGLPRPE
jgi:hypothetical protein